MSKYVSQSYYIPVFPVICPGKQVPQVVRVDLASGYRSSYFEPFHHLPDIAPVQSPAAFRNEYRAGTDAVFPAESFELARQTVRDQDIADLSL